MIDYEEHLSFLKEKQESKCGRWASASFLWSLFFRYAVNISTRCKLSSAYVWFVSRIDCILLKPQCVSVIIIKGNFTIKLYKK
jgi:hypothetical protein